MTSHAHPTAFLFLPYFPFIPSPSPSSTLFHCAALRGLFLGVCRGSGTRSPSRGDTSSSGACSSHGGQLLGCAIAGRSCCAPISCAGAWPALSWLCRASELLISCFSGLCSRGGGAWLDLQAVGEACSKKQDFGPPCRVLESSWQVLGEL